MDSFLELDSLRDVFVYSSAFFGAFLAAFWLSLIFWTYRDIRSRTRDRIIHILASFLVALLSLPGLLIYLILRPKVTLVEAYQRTLEEEALLTEIETRKVCPGCSSTIKQDWQICAYCHTRVQKLCTHCGMLLELPWQICPYCATPVPGSPHTVIEPEEEPLSTSAEEIKEPSLPEETESEIVEDSS